MELSPYLNFNSQCEAAFEFYERCLGGKIAAMATHGGTPSAEHVPPDWRKKILHVQMVVGNQVVMGTDAPSDRYEPQKGFSVSLQVDRPVEAERVFRALAENGSVRMPIQQTFWAARFGMLVTSSACRGWSTVPQLPRRNRTRA